MTRAFARALDKGLLPLAFSIILILGVGLTAFLTWAILWYWWDTRPWVVFVAGILLIAYDWLFRGHGSGPAPSVAASAPPPQIRVDSIPIAGGVGLIFTLGYIVMFWFGAPQYRPFVVTAAVLGGLLGAILIRRASARPAAARGLVKEHGE